MSRRTGRGGGLANWRLLSGRDLPTGPHQKSVHTEGQRQAQAAGHRDVDFIMHLVQLGFGDVGRCGASWQPNPAVCDLSRR
ncbi:MAG: hypothetical protein QOK38_125 [Acidobacteriaceae bacterium]|nr:hypothetical protein [Acidobacteriaceae bacterium]